MFINIAENNSSFAHTDYTDPCLYAFIRFLKYKYLDMSIQYLYGNTSINCAVYHEQTATGHPYIYMMLSPCVTSVDANKTILLCDILMVGVLQVQFGLKKYNWIWDNAIYICCFSNSQSLVKYDQ